jgi:hypothetical protein
LPNSGRMGRWCTCAWKRHRARLTLKQLES